MGVADATVTGGRARRQVAGWLLALWPCWAMAAEPRLETLTVTEMSKGLTQACAADRFCVALDLPQVACADHGCGGGPLDGATLSLLRPQDASGAVPAALALAQLSLAEDVSSVEPWAQLIRFDGGVLAGVKARASVMYSGGWAHATTLHLIAFLPGQDPFEALQVPLNADKAIRACFSEKDFRQRAGVCHDAYDFEARLTLAPGEKEVMPVLNYRSKATTFPAGVSLSRDSLAAPALRKHDIVRQVDPACSYRRTYRFDAQARTYVPNRVEPDCSDYTSP
jgi:hypothetical protein